MGREGANSGNLKFESSSCIDGKKGGNHQKLVKDDITNEEA